MADEQAQVVQVEAPSVPAQIPAQRPASKPSLVDQYDLGDTGYNESAEQARSEAPAESLSPPPEPVRQLPPRDLDTGKFVKPAVHSNRIRQMALDFGIPDGEIEQAAPEELERTVYHLHRQQLDFQKANNRERILLAGGDNQAPLVSRVQEPALSSEVSSQTPPPAASPAEDDLGIKKMLDAGYDADLLGVISKLHEEVKELRQLKPLVGQLAQREQGRAMESFAAQVDHEFQRHKQWLGEGRGFNMPNDDPYKVRRRAVINEMNGMKGGTLKERVDKAVELLYGGAPAPARGQREPANRLNGITPEQWDEAAVSRPTNRNTRGDQPKGVERAVQAVADAQREMGIETDELTEDAFPE